MPAHKRPPDLRWSTVQEMVAGILIGLAVVIVLVGALMLTDWMNER